MHSSMLVLLVGACAVATALAAGQYYVPRAYYTIDNAGHESAPVPLRRLRRSLHTVPLLHSYGGSAASASADATAESNGGGDAVANANARASSSSGGFGGGGGGGGGGGRYLGGGGGGVHYPGGWAGGGHGHSHGHGHGSVHPVLGYH